MIAAWADAGAPKGDPADLPPPREFLDANEWELGAAAARRKVGRIRVPADFGSSGARRIDSGAYDPAGKDRRRSLI